MARSSRRDALRADMNAVGRLLANLPESSVLDRMSLQYRLSELSEQLASVNAEEPDTFASVELLFGGDPVFGTTGIDARFGARVVDTFQRAVSAAAASAGGASLGSRGPLPEGIARLHVTNVVRGSFGFRLEELGQQELIGSRLREAVGQIETVLDSLTKPNEEVFADAVEDVDPRVVTALQDFMGALSQAHAVCRVVAPDREVYFASAEVVDAAAKRIQSYTVSEEENEVQGVLWGVLPDSRRFEFKTSDDEMLRGRLGRSVTDPEQLQRLTGEICTAVIRTTTVQRPQGISRRLSLLSVRSDKTKDLLG